MIGYCIQTHGAGENHLLNLCVAPGWQRQGLGIILLEHAIRLAASQDCHCMFLEVRPSNKAGFRLYRKNGFNEVGRRPDYYRSSGRQEDAIVMRFELGGSSRCQSRNASS